WKDGLFLAAYPLIGGGLIAWIRRNPARPRWESLVDAGIVASGVAAVNWTVIIEPFLISPTLDRPHVTSYIMYAVIDLGLVVITARLGFGATLRTPSHRLVLGAAAALLVGD